MYQDFVKMAKDMIYEYGTKGQVLKQIVSSDPDEPWISNTATESYVTDIVVLPMDKYSRETLRLDFLKNVVESSYVAYIPYTGFTPDLNCKLTVGNKNYNIETVVEYAPNGEKILYVLGLS